MQVFPYMLLGLLNVNEIDEDVSTDPTQQIVQAWYRFSNWRFELVNKLGSTKLSIEEFTKKNEKGAN